MWEWFDKIYCISLVQRADRRKEAEKQFKSVGLADLVAFHIVNKHPDNPEQGIYESHMDCMKMGLATGARHIVIFEDDILFDRFDPEILRNGIDFMVSGIPWNMMHLGCMVKGSRSSDYPSVRKVRYRSLTHACVLNRIFAEQLAKHPWNGIPYDDFLRDLQDDHTYALCPSFAFQNNSRSDNDRYLPLDRVRRIFGGLCRLQKINELYHRYRSLIIAAHILAVAGILMWVAT